MGVSGDDIGCTGDDSGTIGVHFERGISGGRHGYAAWLYCQHDDIHRTHVTPVRDRKAR